MRQHLADVAPDDIVIHGMTLEDPVGTLGVLWADPMDAPNCFGLHVEVGRQFHQNHNVAPVIRGLCLFHRRDM